MEEQRWGGGEGKKRPQRLTWIDLCNALLRHGDVSPLVPPSSERGTAVVQEIHLQTVQTHIRCAENQLGLLPHEV